MNVDAARGRALIEESPELVLVLDSEGRVVAASRRARESLADVELRNAVVTGGRDLAACVPCSQPGSPHR